MIAREDGSSPVPGWEKKDNKFVCLVKECKREECKSLYAFRRHWNYFHASHVTVYKCPEVNCRTECIREDDLITHLISNKHGWSNAGAASMRGSFEFHIRKNNKFRNPSRMVGPKQAANGVPKAGKRGASGAENVPPAKLMKMSEENAPGRPHSMLQDLRSTLKSTLSDFRAKSVESSKAPKSAAEANADLIRKRHRRDQLVKEVDAAENAVRVLERKELERRNQNLSKALECERQKRREAEKLATSPFSIPGNTDKRLDEERRRRKEAEAKVAQLEEENKKLKAALSLLTQ